MEAFSFARAARRSNLSVFLRLAYALIVTIVALLLAAAPSPAKQKAITGTLSKKGYTVVALAENGKAASVKARSGAFKIVPTAAKVTLHLRSSDGTYAGPVVVGGKGRSAILGVKAGAQLGRVAVKRGYATATPAKRFINKSVSSQASKGVPIGAGVFGRVKSSKTKTGGAGNDQDQDGVPGAFDVDDDGDLLLDNFETSTARGASLDAFDSTPLPPPPDGQAPAPGPGSPPPGGEATSFRVFSNFKLDMANSLNANAGGVTDDQIDRAVSSAASLAIQVAGGSSAELDCGGLTYCSAGGTGKKMEDKTPFPGCCDSDDDGWGTITAGATGDFQLLAGAKAADIGSGDAFIEHVTSGGTDTQLPGILNYVFSTTPALKSWSTTASSGTVTYPVGDMALGTPNNAITVGADGIATLTFWRPQRKAIAGSGEGAGWVDIGHLRYTADVPNGPSGPSPGRGPNNCPGSSYTTTDPNLTVDSEGPRDSADDKAADPANTLTFSINLVACLASASLTWNSGASLSVDIQARSEFGDNAAQKIYFRMQ